MITILNKPIGEIGALKVLKVATWSFAIIAIIKFLNDYSSGQQNYILYGVEFSLIFLLREFKRQVFSIMITTFYLIPTLFFLYYIVKNNAYDQLSFIVFYLFLLFLCYRSYQATRIIHGKLKINSKYTHFAWVVYLLIVSIAYVFLVLSTFNDNIPILQDYIDIPFSITGLLGLFCYVFKIKVFNPIFWKIAFFAIIVWHIFEFVYYPSPEIPNDISSYMTVGLFIIMIVLIFPVYTALYLYSYKSFEIWNKQTTAKIA